MFCNKLYQKCVYLFKQTDRIVYINFKRKLVKLAFKQDNNNDDLLIRCKRKEYNQNKGEKHEQFKEIVLASKGWTHNKSKGDYFIVNPNTHSEESSHFELSELGFHSKIVKCLQDNNIKTLTAFQNDAIRTISEGNHSIIAAETGCGKTLTYLLPILSKLHNSASVGVNTPRALILVPSRELAYQIGSTAEKLANEINLKVKVIVGGRTKKAMLNPDFSEVDILIGTPGAIGKLSTIGLYKLNHVISAVLDEADTLIDDSFIERLTGIIKRLGKSQIILVSATLPTNIPVILEPYNEHFVKVTSPLIHKPLNHITQVFMRTGKATKPQYLLEIVKNTSSPLLIFTNRNETCNWVSRFLNENGIQPSRVNGDMNYADRIVQWNRFQSQRNRILVATDVCSRGIHISNIKHVINYDFPFYVADYLHRIGRTGRFGDKFCKVTNFVSNDSEIKLVQKIELAIRKNETLPNVDGNITRIVQKKILRKLGEEYLMK